MIGQLLLIRGWWAPRQVGWSPRIRHSDTDGMPKPHKRPKAAKPGKAMRSTKELTPASLPASELRRRKSRDPDVQLVMPELAGVLAHPLHGVDALQELRAALALIGLDPSKDPGPEQLALLRQATARTAHSEQVALALEHAAEAMAQARSRPKTMYEVQREAAELKRRVLATMALRRLLERDPVTCGDDDRIPLVMDGELVALVSPEQDARAALLTVKLPRVVIDRLRSAVHALAPDRTMGGIVALGVQLVLDQLEARYLVATGRRFPKRSKALEGGRPSRTRATTAMEAPRAPKRPRAR